MKISDFVKSEVEKCLAECNFTKEEKELFLLRTEDTTFEQCANEMNISLSTVYRLNRKINKKIEKVKIYNYNNNIERCKI